MAKHEYINDFLYFVVRTKKDGDKDRMSFCSGINLDRFLPMIKLRCGIGGNPILSGLQLVNFDICAMGKFKGSTFKVLDGQACSGIAPTREAWYTLQMMIESSSDLSPDELISYGVSTLVKKIVDCSGLEYRAPEKLLEPDELQVYLENLCRAITEQTARSGALCSAAA